MEESLTRLMLELFPCIFRQCQTEALDKSHCSNSRDFHPVGNVNCRSDTIFELIEIIYYIVACFYLQIDNRKILQYTVFVFICS